MTLKSEIKQHPERSMPEEFNHILSEAYVAHVGFSEGQQPYIIPFSYHFDSKNPNSIYIHGSHKSRALKYLAEGHPSCIEITLLDGLIYSKTALHHSMNYRSAICFGKGRSIENRELKYQIFLDMVEKYFPNRKANIDYQAPPADHLDATFLIEIVIDKKSAKVRKGGPTGPQDDLPAIAGSAGVVELKVKE